MANPEHLARLKAYGSALTEVRNLLGHMVWPIDSSLLAKAQAPRLAGADLTNADLSQAVLYQIDFEGADLSGADLSGAELASANLTGADLSQADLSGADLTGANLNGADLSECALYHTLFSGVDLSQVKGLNAVRHDGPVSAIIDIGTLYRSQGHISETFLIGSGVPENFIQDILPSIRGGPLIQWHSCFISYSGKDEQFARRLHSRMREANLRVWFAPEDVRGGEKLHEQLFRAIQLYDKLLLVLSLQSLQSEWVMTEIRKAREVEKREQRRKLFPIRLADFDTLRAWTCFDADTGKDLAVEVREYFIPDFSNWKDHAAFEAAFARLREDLKTP